MEKDFMEVFPDLEVDGELADLLDVVQVTRVGITRKKRPDAGLYCLQSVDS